MWRFKALNKHKAQCPRAFVDVLKARWTYGCTCVTSVYVHAHDVGVSVCLYLCLYNNVYRHLGLCGGSGGILAVRGLFKEECGHKMMTPPAPTACVDLQSCAHICIGHRSEVL